MCYSAIQEFTATLKMPDMPDSELQVRFAIQCEVALCPVQHKFAGCLTESILVRSLIVRLFWRSLIEHLPLMRSLTVQEYLEAHEPPFSLIGICDLVPEDRRHAFEEAGGEAA